METTYKLAQGLNMNTLKAMQRAGLIKLHKDTGTKINGRTIYYIDDLTEGTSIHFIIRINRTCWYLSGCFCPLCIEKLLNKTIKL